MATATTQNKTLTQGQNFTDTAGRTGVVNYDTATGKPLATGASTLATPPVTSIPVDTLTTTPPPPVVPPPTVQTGTSALAGTLESFLTQKKVEDQKNADAAKTNLTSNQNDIIKNILDIGKAPGTVDRSAENAAKVKYDTFSSQLEQEQLANRRATEAIQSDPGIATAEQRNAEIADVTRKSLSKQADIAIHQSAASRDYATANAIANQEVQNKLEPLKAALDARKFIYENNKDLFDKADAKLLKDEERQYEQTAKDFDRIKEIKLEAAKQGASVETLNALSSAASLQDALKIPGIKKYLTTDAERLDIALKRAQLNKLNASSTSVDAPTIKSINGVDKQWDPKSKTWVDPTGVTGSGSSSTVSMLQDRINNIDSVLKNTQGLKSAVGTNVFARDKIDLTGKKQNFIAGVQQLVSQDTLNTLINLKKQGGTLGALSDQERVMLQTAATKIGQWANTNSKGKVTGYNASEKDFKKELDTIKMLTERAYHEAAGTTDTYLDSVDAALQDVNSPYSQYIND